MSFEKTCFVIAPIGDPDSETRKRSDQVLNYIVRPAVEDCGYKAIRADEIDKPGIITSQVIQHVVNDELVVADLTERNPNVFYELAVRHALRKPLVQLIRKGESIPFDVAGTRTIHFDHRDLDSVDKAKSEIIEQVHSLEADASEIETPISVSLDLQLLRQSERPEDRSLADLVGFMSDLRTGLGRLEARIGTQEEEGMLDEIQSTLRTLPHRLDDYFERSRGLLAVGGRRGLDPRMLLDLISMGTERTPEIGILVVGSFFRDSMPWVHELGLEAFRALRSNDVGKAREAVSEFRRLVDLSLHGPWGREMFGRSKEFFMLREEIEPLLERTIEMAMPGIDASEAEDSDSDTPGNAEEAS